MIYSHDPTRVMSLGDRENTEVKCHFCHIISRIYTINMTQLITFEVDLDRLAEVLFVQFLLCKVTAPLSLFTLYSVEGSHYSVHT